MDARSARCVVASLVLLLVLGGCSGDTERSWAYPYRYTWEEPTVTQRVSKHYRTKEECERQRAEFSRFQMALDRCVLQPPISLGWIEWEVSIVFKVQAANEPSQQSDVTFIAQTLSDCRKLRDGVTAGLQKEMQSHAAPGVAVTVSEGSCKPVYIGRREEFTPLQVSDFEGILVRTRVAKEVSK